MVSTVELSHLPSFDSCATILQIPLFLASIRDHRHISELSYFLALPGNVLPCRVNDYRIVIFNALLVCVEHVGLAKIERLADGGVGWAHHMDKGSPNRPTRALCEGTFPSTQSPEKSK
jgi:hypothetical protein